MAAAYRLPDPPALPGYTRESEEMGGGGANGLVFRARCDATRELVAIKYIYRADLEQVTDSRTTPLERELRNHALSVHPHIAGFRQAVLLPEWVAIVLELCEGRGNLLAWLNMQPQRQASETVARGIIVQILSALHHMHGVGIVHRDIKARAPARPRARAAAAAACGLTSAYLPSCAARRLPGVAAAGRAAPERCVPPRRPTTSAWRAPRCPARCPR